MFRYYNLGSSECVTRKSVILLQKIWGFRHVSALLYFGSVSLHYRVLYAACVARRRLPIGR